MKRSPRPRRTAEISQSLYRQLNSYALAAGAAGVSALALGQPAEAKIVYTPAHLKIGGGVGRVREYKLDLNHDGVPDITFGTNVNSCTDGCAAGLFATLPIDNQLRGQKVASGSYYVSALREGVKVDGASMIACPRFGCLMAASGTGAYGPGGKWHDVRNRYIGLKFKIKGKSHFGWVRLSVAMKPTQVKATLTGYAYETIPNKPIITGNTHGPDVIAKHASLGELALGRK